MTRILAVLALLLLAGCGYRVVWRSSCAPALTDAPEYHGECPTLP